MESGFLVAAKPIVNPGEFQSDSGQIRSVRQNCLEPPGGLAQEAELRLGETEEKQPFDPLVLVGGPHPFQDRAGIIRSACLQKHAASLQGRNLDRVNDVLFRKAGGRSGGDRKRRQNTRHDPGQPAHNPPLRLKGLCSSPIVCRLRTSLRSGLRFLRPQLRKPLRPPRRRARRRLRPPIRSRIQRVRRIPQDRWRTTCFRSPWR